MGNETSTSSFDFVIVNRSLSHLYCWLAMRHRRLKLAGILTVLVVGLTIAYRSSCQNRTEIRARYQKLTTALSSGDTNAVLALIAPESRKEFDDGRFMRMIGFAKPIGPRSKIFILGKGATVWPSPNWYLCGLWPIGDAVGMTKVAGSWFFTGVVHID